MPQEKNIVQAQASETPQDNARPIKGDIPPILPHTQVRPTTHTSGYWRLTTSTLTFRYLLEGLRDTVRDHIHFKRLESKVAGTVEEIKNAASGDAPRALQMLKNYAIKKPEAVLNAIKAGATDKLEQVGDVVRQHAYTRAYDTTLGGFCAGLTLTHTYNTAYTIKKMYAEAVALELGKRPEEVTFTDLRQSKNEIVQNGLHNAVTLNAARLAADSVFFGRNLGKLEGVWSELGRARSIPFGYYGLGLKGALLMRDITSRQATMFETLTDFTDRKINPFHGIAESVTSSDIVDIYQKYAEFAKPSAMFKDVTVNQRQDAELDWPKSEKIFMRVAELMNQSYKYKKSNLPDEERSLQSSQVRVNFTLPNYIHMLGNGMIDPLHPEETVTLIEVAARQDIKSLNLAADMLRKGTPVQEVEKRFGVTDFVRSAMNTKVQDTQSVTAQSNATPENQVYAAQAVGQVQAPTNVRFH